MSQPSANDLFRECQRLIRLGQPVFPCRSTSVKAKAPMTTNGWKDATKDIKQVKSWWQRHGTASIGIPTGILWDVLDVDVKDGSDGRVHLPYLQSLGLLNGCQRLVRTPSGGWHLYFNATPTLTNKARGATLGLDVRAKGGYVLAPPSYLTDAVNSAGETYSGHYEEQEAPVGGNTDPLYWDLIVSALQPINPTTNQPIPLLPSERRASLASLREWVSIRQAGERNNALHWAVCRCIDSGLDPHELFEPALLSGLGEEEVLLTINSALKRAGVIAEDLLSEAEALSPEDMG